MADDKPTVKMSLAEIAGTDHWLSAVAALDRLPVPWGLEVFALGIYTEIVQIASAMRHPGADRAAGVHLLRQLVEALARLSGPLAESDPGERGSG